jgi:hypothetical protein
LNEECIKILPKYYKEIEGLHYSYGSYGSHEADFVNLSHVICLIALTRDVEIEDFLLAQKDKKALDNYVKNKPWGPNRLILKWVNPNRATLVY